MLEPEAKGKLLEAMLSLFKTLIFCSLWRLYISFHSFNVAFKYYLSLLLSFSVPFKFGTRVGASLTSPSKTPLRTGQKGGFPSNSQATIYGGLLVNTTSQFSSKMSHLLPLGFWKQGEVFKILHLGSHPQLSPNS